MDLIAYIKSNFSFRAKIEAGVFIRTDAVIFCEEDSVKRRVDDALRDRYSISSEWIEEGLLISGVDCDRLGGVLRGGDDLWPDSDQVSL